MVCPDTLVMGTPMVQRHISCIYKPGNEYGDGDMIKLSARPPGLFSAMFNRQRLFDELPCPLTDACSRPICLFSHKPSPAPTPVVPAKRRAPDVQPDPPQVPQSSRQSSANAERPTKFLKAGSAAKPVPVPTASSSPVSRAPIPRPRFTHQKSRLVFQSLGSMLDSQRYPFRRARYVTRLVSVQPQRGIHTSYPCPFLSSFVSPLYAHILVSPSRSY